MYQKVLDKLNELGIPFQIVEHEPVLTTEHKQIVLLKELKVFVQRQCF